MQGEPKISFFGADVKLGNKDLVQKKVGAKFSGMAAGMEKFSLDLLRDVQKECGLELGCEGVWNLWLQVHLVI